MKTCRLFSLTLLSLLLLNLSYTTPLAKAKLPASTKLAPGDTINISIKNKPLLQHMAGKYTITPSGTINMAGVDNIPASGISVNNLQESVRKLFRNITSGNSGAKVTLIKQNRYILMGKGVRYPGWYQVPLRPSIEALTEIASGIQPEAETKNAKILRTSSGKTKEIPYKKALPLQSFDKLTLTVKSSNTIVDSGDLLYVIIPKEITGEFSPTERNYFKEKVEVDRHGYIFLPSQGNIKIEGYTTAEISEILTNNLPKYLSKSDKASVNLIEKRHYIQILGHVSIPGWYNIPESANIQAILGQAGGSLENADLQRLTISRKETSNEINLLADVQYYLSKGDSRMLPVLHENDTVFVPLAPVVKVGQDNDGLDVSKTPKIRIFGAINSPGIYPAPKGMNLLDLLITAQGEAADADLGQIKIMRANGEKEIFNLQTLLDSDSSNKKTMFPMIKGGDIVHIARVDPKLVMNPATEQKEPMRPQLITMTGPGSNGRGLHPFSPPMTPLEAIAQAGGVNEFADVNDIVILRRVDGKQKRFEYDYDSALKGRMPDVDFQLMTGDIIYIP